MSKSNPHTPENAPSSASKHLRTAALLALVAAAAPHFFLDMPLVAYEAGNLRGWLGLSIWSPAFLGAVALFFGVDWEARVPRPWLPNVEVRAGAAIAMSVLVLVLLTIRYLPGFHTVGDWRELGLAMLLYAGTFAVGVLFWQGLVQQELLARMGRSAAGRLLRVALIAAVACALWVPFLSNHSLDMLRQTLDGYLVIYLALALLFELGVSVFGCLGIAVLMGVSWAWVHQMTFF